jgi:hypothetical protein
MSNQNFGKQGSRKVDGHREGILVAIVANGYGLDSATAGRGTAL